MADIDDVIKDERTEYAETIVQASQRLTGLVTDILIIKAMPTNLKRGILRFSEAISAGLSRPQLKFIAQLIYGMLAAQSCHLTKIARVLGEGISLKW